MILLDLLTKSLGYIPGKHKVSGKTLFMFFDTNEIQIQVGCCLIMKMYSFQFLIFVRLFSRYIFKKYIQKIDPKTNTKTKFKKHMVYVSKIFEICGSQISIDNIFQDVPIIFLDSVRSNSV